MAFYEQEFIEIKREKAKMEIYGKDTIVAIYYEYMDTYQERRRPAPLRRGFPRPGEGAI